MQLKKLLALFSVMALSALVGIRANQQAVAETFVEIDDVQPNVLTQSEVQQAEPVVTLDQEKDNAQKGEAKPEDTTEPVDDDQEDRDEEKSLDKEPVNAVVPTGPALPSGPVEMDKILVIVYTPEAIDVITQSVLDRVPLDGRQRTLDDAIFDILVYRDALYRFKFTVDEQVIDNYIETFKRENRLTDAQVRQMFNDAGYTYAEGREQFRQMHTVGQLLGFRVHSRVYASERDIIEYCRQHPEIVPATYTLERAFIPVASKDVREAIRKQVEQFVRTGVGFEDVEWGEFPTVTADELSDDKKHLVKLAVGQVEMSEKSDGFELIRMKTMTPGGERPVEERRVEVAQLLQQPKFEALLEAYKKELYDAATIVYV